MQSTWEELVEKIGRCRIEQALSYQVYAYEIKQKQLTYTEVLSITYALYQLETGWLARTADWGSFFRRSFSDLQSDIAAAVEEKFGHIKGERQHKVVDREQLLKTEVRVEKPIKEQADVYPE